MLTTTALRLIVKITSSVDEWHPSIVSFRQTNQNLHFNEVLGQDRDLGLQRVDLVLRSEGVDEDEPVNPPDPDIQGVREKRALDSVAFVCYHGEHLCKYEISC